MEYTQKEQKLMHEYQKKTGRKLLSQDERYRQYQEMDDISRLYNKNGLLDSIQARLSLDNDDVFDGPDDPWKLKFLQENLEMTLEIEGKGR